MSGLDIRCRLFLTTSRGLEEIAAAEVAVLGASDINLADGKVFFCLPLDKPWQEPLGRLRAAERVFAQVCLFHPAPKLPPTATDQAAGLSQLQALCCGPIDRADDRVCWLDAVRVWQATRKDWNCRVGPLTFRVSCKSKGATSRAYPPHALAQVVEEGMTERYGWTVDRDRFELEVTVQLNDCWLLVGLPLFRELAARDYSTAGIRSTVGYALTAVAQEFLRPGSLIVDPMAGVGTVLIEGCRAFPMHRYIGGDADRAQVDRMMENIRTTSLQGRIGVLHWDATRLPFRSCSVDCIAVDAPFGRKHTAGTDLPQLYRKLLSEFGRVLRPFGCLVFLTGTAGALVIDSLVHSTAGTAASGAGNHDVRGLYPGLSGLDDGKRSRKGGGGPMDSVDGTLNPGIGPGATAAPQPLDYVWAVRRRLELKLGALYAILFVLVKVPRGKEASIKQLPDVMAAERERQADIRRQREPQGSGSARGRGRASRFAR